MPAPLTPTTAPSDACVNCKKTATRLVEVTVMSTELGPLQYRTCAEHAREYATNRSLSKVLARMLAMTTSAMPAPVRSRHTKAVLIDNGLDIGEEGEVAKVTTEHVGPTHVYCDLIHLARVREVLEFQGWSVKSSPEVLNELIVEHDKPERASLPEVAPGIAHAVVTVRLDELDKVAKMVDDLKEGEDDAGVLRTLTTIDDMIDARRVELGGGER